MGQFQKFEYNEGQDEFSMSSSLGNGFSTYLPPKVSCCCVDSEN